MPTRSLDCWPGGTCKLSAIGSAPPRWHGRRGDLVGPTCWNSASTRICSLSWADAVAEPGILEPAQADAKDTQAVARALDLPWPDAEDELLATLRERIRPDLRHCQAPRTLMLPFVAETYAALKQAAVGGRIPDTFRQLDREVRRALALSEPWASVVDALTRPKNFPQFSFVEHFFEGHLAHVALQEVELLAALLRDISRQRQLIQRQIITDDAVAATREGASGEGRCSSVGRARPW